MTVTVTKYGKQENVTVTAAEIAQYQNQGMGVDQVVDRVAKTLITALDREANDIPF